MAPPLKPQSPQQWERRFLANVRRDRTAQQAWTEIERAGIADAVKVLLYAPFGGQYLRALFENARRLADQAETAQRAVSVAEAWHRGPRAGLFSARAQRQRNRLAQAAWVL